MTAPKLPGEQVDEVVVEIDYEIISHFSDHLYTSPNKAIEELVSNGYDAFAERVHIYIPGRFTADRVLVWDDGASMGVDDIKKLWWIASSPKTQVPGRVVNKGDRTRKMIGKFGIGKLACYAVGYRISHLCRHDGRFLLVGVDYRDVPHLEDDGEKRYRTPIRELDSTGAMEWVRSHFGDDEEPSAIDELFDGETWTLAVIDEIKPGIRLTPGRLRWVISHGIPLRPDFKVSVDDEEVHPRLAGEALATWNMGEQVLRESIRSAWSEAVAADRVEGEVEFSNDGEPAVVFPNLGPVTGAVRLFAQSLKHGLEGGEDEARSYGFFILVRGRLLNPDDAEFNMSPPSYGTFYRSQFEIHADGLDDVLLADREGVFGPSAHRRELEVVQRAVYLAARTEHERRDEEREGDERSESLLPIGSRSYFREPLNALFLRRADEEEALFNVLETRVERARLEPSQPLAELDIGFGGFRVNEAHPFFVSVRERFGGGKKAQELLRTIDILAVAERLFEGYLYDLGLAEQQIDQILTWRDSLLRTLGSRIAATPEELERKVREASYVGGASFEVTIADLFSAMGFEASRHGASGEKDVLVVAPIGRDELRFVVEAKGSRGAISNDDADVAIAAAHREDVEGARFALIVAREFQGFKQAKEPQLLKDCRATGGVSLATIDTLIELYRANAKLAYPLELLPPVLEILETPDEKLARVTKLENPTSDFDWKSLLQEIWERQQSDAAGDVVPYRSVWQSSWRQEMSDEEFTLMLTALEVLSGGLIVVDTKKEHVTLRQNPDIIEGKISRHDD